MLIPFMLQYNVTIYLKKTRDDPEFTPIFTFYEEDACTAIQKYLGDMVEDMEKAAGMDPGKCPIPKVWRTKQKSYIYLW